MSYSNEQVIAALAHVIDPDLKKDLVTLRMIENITISGNKISFKLVLTTPACPLKQEIKKACIDAIHQYIDKQIDVQVEITSRVTSVRAEKEKLLPGVKNIIIVASGKGGVGKSTIAANIAVALAKTGAKVGLVDADIYGPSIPLMFDIVEKAPNVVEKEGVSKIVPIEKYGVKILSIGFFSNPGKALVWRGPMASNALKHLFTFGEWGELDYMVIDMPPGTGDIHLTLVQSLPVTGAVIVTTPQKVAISDVRKAVDMLRQDGINVPILGLVENMSYFTPAEVPDQRYYIFGKEGGKAFAEESNIPLLGEIPYVYSICDSCDKGSPIALDDKSPMSKAFLSLAEKLAQQIALLNAAKKKALVS